MKTIVATLSMLCLIATLPMDALASSSTAIPISQQGTIESDGDGIADISDNAPGTPNVDQLDDDADGIGNIIDPNSTDANPNLGDPGLGVFDAPDISPGGTASFDYVLNVTPPGGWGRILIDFDLNNTTDAVAFGALNTSINKVFIPASLYTSANWDLNTPGTYSVGMKAWAPGMTSDNWAFPSVTVVPEPSSLAMALLVGMLALGRRLNRRK